MNINWPKFAQYWDTVDGVFTRNLQSLATGEWCWEYLDKDGQWLPLSQNFNPIQTGQFLGKLALFELAEQFVQSTKARDLTWTDIEKTYALLNPAIVSMDDDQTVGTRTIESLKTDFIDSTLRYVDIANIAAWHEHRIKCINTKWLLFPKKTSINIDDEFHQLDEQHRSPLCQCRDDRKSITINVGVEVKPTSKEELESLIQLTSTISGVVVKALCTHPHITQSQQFKQHVNNAFDQLILAQNLLEQELLNK